MGVPKLLRLGLSQFCRFITFCVDLRLGWCVNWRYSPRQELSNGVSHATYTQGNMVDSWLSVVRSQTTNLIPDFSFGHNLCCRCPNGSCKPILDIYASIDFQWYKELFKTRGFSLFNRSMKFQESTGILIPNMGVHLGVWEFIFTLSHTLGSLSWPNLLQTRALVVSPRLGLWHSTNTTTKGGGVDLLGVAPKERNNIKGGSKT
jgi:hypothetical protein